MSRERAKKQKRRPQQKDRWFVFPPENSNLLYSNNPLEYANSIREPKIKNISNAVNESRKNSLLAYNSYIFRMLNIEVVPGQQEGGLEGCQEPVLTPESRGTSSTLQVSRYPQSPAGLINYDRMTSISWYL